MRQSLLKFWFFVLLLIYSSYTYSESCILLTIDKFFLLIEGSEGIQPELLEKIEANILEWARNNELKIEKLEKRYKELPENIITVEVKAKEFSLFYLKIELKLKECSFSGSYSNLSKEELIDKVKEFLSNIYTKQKKRELESIHSKLIPFKTEVKSLKKESKKTSFIPFVINNTGLGLYLGFASYMAIETQNLTFLAPALLAGGGTGLAISLIYKYIWGKVSLGDTSLITVGGWSGVTTGILATLIFSDNIELIFGISGIGGLFGIGMGILASYYTELSDGDGGLILSGPFWGLYLGTIILFLSLPPDEEYISGILLAGLYTGILSSAILTKWIEVSITRMIVIDLCGLLGILLGASLGLPIVLDGGDESDIRIYTAIILASTALGIGLGTYFTKNWDKEKEIVEEIAGNNSIFNIDLRKKRFNIGFPMFSFYNNHNEKIFYLNLLSGRW